MQQSKGDENLVKKTLITTAVMMGASVVFVGALSLIASVAAGRAVGAPSESATETAAGTAVPGRAEPLAPAKALNRRGRGAAKGAESL
jgi:hypothetical protein